MTQLHTMFPKTITSHSSCAFLKWHSLSPNSGAERWRWGQQDFMTCPTSIKWRKNMTQLICAHTLAAVLVAKRYQQHNEGTDRSYELLKINQLHYFPSTSLTEIPVSFPLCIQKPFIWSTTETSLYREQIIMHVKNLSCLMATDESSTTVKCCLKKERSRISCSWHFSLLQCPPHCWSCPTLPCLSLHGIVGFSAPLSRNSSPIGKQCQEYVIIYYYSLSHLIRLL